jgi:hypothetical protein
MNWRFRKSFTPIPGVRLTLSPSGISTSVGVGPLRVTAGPRGSSMTLGVPGTGLSFVQPLGQSPAAPVGQPFVGAFVQPAAPPSPKLSGPGMQEIRSAGSSGLTTAGLTAFKEALLLADRQFASISAELDDASRKADQHVEQHRRWANGWVLRHILKKRFAELASQAEESVARRQELREQLQLSTLQTEFEMPDGVAKTYESLCDAFQACTRSQRIWDNVAHRVANRVAERTTAGRIVDLKPVSFKLGTCGVIDAAQAVPHLQNANGGDIYFYPGFLVYHASATNYALIEYHNLDLAVMATQFHEEKAVPTDAKQVDTTWAKANKDGSPDRRFANNYQIPVMLYAKLTLKTPSGLNEEYLLSNLDACRQFGQAWGEMLSALKSGR